MAFCPYCGNNIQEGMKFCINCGKPVPEQLLGTTAAAPQVEPIPVAVPVAEPAPAPVEEKTVAQTPPEEPENVVCPNCGKVLRPGTKFCNGCGGQITAAVVAAPKADPTPAPEGEEPAPIATPRKKSGGKAVVICIVLLLVAALAVGGSWAFGAFGDGGLFAEGGLLDGSNQTEGTKGDPTEGSTEPQAPSGTGTTDPTGTRPTDPEPTDPEPTDPEPTEPKPTEPKPTEPEPTEPEPTEPEPTEPEPTEPEPTEPEPTEPKPTEPEPTEPEPTEPEPTEPEPTESEPTETEPTETEPSDQTTSIVGTWNGSVDMADSFNAGLVQGNPESAQFLSADSLVVTVVMIFDDDGIMTYYIDQESYEAAVQALREEWVLGLADYITYIIDTNGLNMTVEEYEKSMGMTVEELADNMISNSCAIDMEGSTMSTVEYELNGDQLAIQGDSGTFTVSISATELDFLSYSGSDSDGSVKAMFVDPIYYRQ